MLRRPTPEGGVPVPPAPHETPGGNGGLSTLRARIMKMRGKDMLDILTGNISDAVKIQEAVATLEQLPAYTTELHKIVRVREGQYQSLILRQESEYRQGVPYAEYAAQPDSDTEGITTLTKEYEQAIGERVSDLESFVDNAAKGQILDCEKVQAWLTAVQSLERNIKKLYNTLSLY